MPETVECAVIGAGPAGLVGALYLLRFRRSVLLANKGSSRAALIPTSHNYPGFPDGVNGKTLLGRLRRQMGRYGTPSLGGEVLSLDPLDGGWLVGLADREVIARRVLREPEAHAIVPVHQDEPIISFDDDDRAVRVPWARALGGS